MKTWKPSIMMITSAFCYSLQYLDVKSISPYFGIWMITFFRGVCSLLLSLSGMLISRHLHPEFQILGNKKKLLLVRGIFGGLSIICSFLAVKNLNLSIATVIVSTGPIFTGLMSCICKKNNWTTINTISLIICFSGLLIICYKGFKDRIANFFIGFVAALSSAIFSALVNITINEIKDENTFIITFYAMSVCILLTFPGMVYETLTHNYFDNSTSLLKIQLCFTGIASFSAQYLKTRSIQISDNLGVIIFRYFDVIFCLVWDVFILDSKLYVYDYVGITLILLGCCVNTFKK
jgi:drug/metabolite transporter (DMT)-like permease